MTAQELKNSILQLAIQGKLVKQNPNDESASILLEKIKVERDKLIKEKKIKKEKYSEIYKDSADNHYYEKFEDGTIKDITEEIPFEIPESWCYVRFSNLINTCYQGINTAADNVVFEKKEGIPILQVGDITSGKINLEGTKLISLDDYEKYKEKYQPEINDIFYCNIGTIGKPLIYTDNYTIVFHWNIFIIKYNCNCILPEFLKAILEHYTNYFKRNTDGTAMQFVSKKKLLSSLFVLPPLQEQLRIVNKLEATLPYIEEYNEKYQKLEKINTNYQEELKKSILQYAIQGKLVKQDSNDEPAEVLINKILDEKRELIKTKQIKKENLSVIYKNGTDNQFYEKFDDGTINNITDEIPFDIPDSWCWTRLGNILTKLSDGTHKTPKYTSNGIPFLSVKDMSSGIISFKNTKYISKEEHQLLYQRCNPEKGDILLSKVGTTGIPVIIDTNKEFSLFVSLALLKFNNTYINKEFLRYLLLSPLVQKQCRENTKGVGNKNWVMKDIAHTLIAIPSFKIQCKITNKLDKLFENI